METETEAKIADQIDLSLDSQDAVKQQSISKVPGRPWPKGVSGNPAGRPRKEHTLTGALERIVDKDQLADELWGIASGRLAESRTQQLEAIKYVYSRIEGNPVQAMRHTSDGTLPGMIILHPGRAPEPELPSLPEATEPE